MSIGACSAGRHRAFTIPKVAERMAAIDDGMRHRGSAFKERAAAQYERFKFLHSRRRPSARSLAHWLPTLMP